MFVFVLHSDLTGREALLNPEDAMGIDELPACSREAHPDAKAIVILRDDYVMFVRETVEQVKDIFYSAGVKVYRSQSYDDSKPEHQPRPLTPISPLPTRLP